MRCRGVFCEIDRHSCEACAGLDEKNTPTLDLNISNKRDARINKKSDIQIVYCLGEYGKSQLPFVSSQISKFGILAVFKLAFCAFHLLLSRQSIKLGSWNA
jgi:hypothetical protein